MPAASAINSFQAFSTSPVVAVPSAGTDSNSSGPSFGQALASARQAGGSSSQSATSSSAQSGDAKTPAQNQARAQDQTTQSQTQAQAQNQTQSQSQVSAQSQAEQDAEQEAQALPDAAPALLQDLSLADTLNPSPATGKASTRTAPTQDKDAAPGDETSSWLAMLQAMQMVQQPAQLQTGTSSDTAAMGSATDGGATKALGALGAAQQGNTAADAAQTQAADASLLAQQGMQANGGKDTGIAADVAAGGGNFSPLLQNAIADDAADNGMDTTALDQLTAAAQHHPVLANQDISAKPATAAHQITEPVTDDKWGAAVAQRVSMMLGKQEQQLDMQLNPPHLGPMEVRLSMAQDQASVIFVSQHAAVRDALAAATPQLSALLANQGITLTNVQVASDSLNQQTQQQSMERQSAGNNEQNQGRNQGNNNQWGGDADSGSQPALTSVSGTIQVPAARSGLNLYI